MHDEANEIYHGHDEENELDGQESKSQVETCQVHQQQSNHQKHVVQENTEKQPRMKVSTWRGRRRQRRVMSTVHDTTKNFASKKAWSKMRMKQKTGKNSHHGPSQK